MTGALDRLIARCGQKVAAERAREAGMIADTVKHGGFLPSNHWQDRWRSEQRLKTALALREALQEPLT